MNTAKQSVAERGRAGKSGGGKEGGEVGEKGVERGGRSFGDTRYIMYINYISIWEERSF